MRRGVPRFLRPSSLPGEMMGLIDAAIGAPPPPLALVTVSPPTYGDNQDSGQDPGGSGSTLKKKVAVPNGSTGTLTLSPASEYTHVILEGGFTRGSLRGICRYSIIYDGASTVTAAIRQSDIEDPGITSIAGAISGGGDLVLTFTADSSGSNVSMELDVRDFKP